MKIKEIINIIKNYVITQYNRFLTFIKNGSDEKPKINNQTNKEIHIVKAKVKKVKVRKIEN